MFPQPQALPARYAALFNTFQERYLKAVVRSPEDLPLAKARLSTFLEHAIAQAKHPYAFAPLHYALRSPIDYHTFGVDFILPLIDLSRSGFLGIEWLKDIEESRQAGENIIFFANHQIEADPQVLSIFLKPHAPKLAEELFCVAGARVTSDPLAIPFTLGCNILSVYSKNHMDSDPDKRTAQQTHNLRTLSALSELLNQGGHAIYVAPSGGRDRPNAEGKLLPASFDPQSIQLFTLLAKKARKPVHFYPMALATYAILPPPDSRQSELGEERYVTRSPVGVAIGPRLDFQTISIASLDSSKEDKETSREARQQAAADYAWQAVFKLYQTLEYTKTSDS